jgi:hypothetical protein
LLQEGVVNELDSARVRDQESSLDERREHRLNLGVLYSEVVAVDPASRQSLTVAAGHEPQHDPPRHLLLARRECVQGCLRVSRDCAVDASGAFVRRQCQRRA